MTGCWGNRVGFISLKNKSAAANLSLKFIQIDRRKAGVQCGLLQTLEGCIGIVMVVDSSWEVQEILPEAMTDLFNECINVYSTGSWKDRVGDIGR